jgi:hypothetical protein
MTQIPTLAIPTEEFPQYAADQLALLFAEAAKAKGRDNAFRHILHALVASHPEPAALKEVLESVRPELVDELITGTDPSALREASLSELASELALVDALVGAVVDRRKRG